MFFHIYMYTSIDADVATTQRRWNKIKTFFLSIRKSFASDVKRLYNKCQIKMKFSSGRVEINTWYYESGSHDHCHSGITFQLWNNIENVNGITIHREMSEIESICNVDTKKMCVLKFLANPWRNRFLVKWNFFVYIGF